MRKFITAMLILVMTFSNTYIFATNVKPTSSPSTVPSEEPIKSNRVKSSKTPEANSSPQASQSPDSTDVAQQEDTKKTAEKTEEKEFVPTGPEVLSEAAILISGNTGKVLYEKNSHAKMFPASTTKIMTAYLALTHLDLAQEITASETAVAIASDGSQMGLIAGEILTAEQLLYALMVQSANDAANALAEAVSGSIDSFVQLMNDTAEELGMHNTHFANPHGYHDETHYTTAYDMVQLAKKAMENKTFAEIVGTVSYTMPPTNKWDKERIFVNRNNLINPRSSLTYRYAYADGIKTGSTSAAGQCLVGSATRSGMSLISVVFKAPKDKPDRAFIDTKRMYEYAYSKYRIRTVQKGDELASTCNVKWAFGKKHLILKTNEDIKTLLPRDDYIPELLTSEITINEDIVAPVKAGDALGEIRYYYDKEQVVSATLYASRDVHRSYVKQFLSYILSFWFLTLLGLVVAWILLKRFKEKKRVARLRKVKKQSVSKRR